MTFRFEHPDRSIGDNIRAAAKGEFDRAIAEVGEAGFEIHETIRNVRRRLKRVRSILRLVRPAFPGFSAENAALRAIGADVSELRDAAALIEAVDRLKGRGGDIAALDRLRRQLAERAAAHEAALERDQFLTALRLMLREARVRSELWELDHLDGEALANGIATTYRVARRTGRAAAKQPHDEQLHEWRKWVKHHSAHLMLLRGVSSEFADGRRLAASRLARTLGDHRNLAILRALLARDDLASESDRAVAGAQADRLLRRLGKRALKLGGPLLAEPASEVEQRWRAYLADWRAARRLWIVD